MRLGEPGWKDRYYQHKLGVGLADDEKRREVNPNPNPNPNPSPDPNPNPNPSPTPHRWQRRM